MDWLTPAATAFLGLLVGVLVSETWNRNADSRAVKAAENAIAKFTSTSGSDKFSIIEPPAEPTLGEHIFNSTPIVEHYDDSDGSQVPVIETSHVPSPPSEQA